ncbi:MAG: AAA family ATPase [Clostridia bacterium]|nr:AAA family ATPase [Clostridia bacterium]
MGAYLNPGKDAFEEAVNSEIFVDKTGMIQYLNLVVKTKQKYVIVSRPRRFGKTMAADMICAYYDREADSHELFQQSGLADTLPVKRGEKELAWDAFLGQFDVIRIVMTDFMEDCETVNDMLSCLTDEVAAELMNGYPDIHYGNRIKLHTVMNEIYAKTKRQFVIVIDEWDAVFRVWKDDIKGQTKYLDFLRNLLKDKAYIALAYMTGILPIKKYGEHSALNMFTEYSMMLPRQLAPYTGFTEEEVMELCKQYNMEYKDISDWYDGYVISDRIPTDERESYRKGDYHGHKISIYSPLSVVESMTTGQIRNYWNRTETYEALAEYIRKDYDGLRDAVALLMDGGKLRIDTSTYQNDMTTFHGKDDILSLLVHLGYLGYDDAASEVFIPNREILDEFKSSTKSAEWTEIFKAYEESAMLLKATWNRQQNEVAELVEKAHNKADNKTYNDEAALSYAIRLAYYAAQKYYTILPETDTGKGYADLILIPAPKYSDKPALVIELKYNKDADGAVAQIRRQAYPDRLEHYKGNILLVGINYDREAANDSPEFKHHTCVIEEA